MQISKYMLKGLLAKGREIQELTGATLEGFYILDFFLKQGREQITIPTDNHNIMRTLNYLMSPEIDRDIETKKLEKTQKEAEEIPSIDLIDNTLSEGEAVANEKPVESGADVKSIAKAVIKKEKEKSLAKNKK